MCSYTFLHFPLPAGGALHHGGAPFPFRASLVLANGPPNALWINEFMRPRRAFRPALHDQRTGLRDIELSARSLCALQDCRTRHKFGIRPGCPMKRASRRYRYMKSRASRDIAASSSRAPIGRPRFVLAKKYLGRLMHEDASHPAKHQHESAPV